MVSSSARAPSKTAAPPRTSSARLKVVIRRLPPGLTETEFWSALGDGWRVNGGKVDWFAYKEGKVTKDISKPSVPGRAYLNLTKAEHLTSLSGIVRDTDFTDAKNTVGDSCLLGAPSLEMATYGRIPTSKPRKDARQGTIDQDSEFMSFLLGLTNPIVKAAPVDVPLSDKDVASLAVEAVTPLIQFLRDKKANKDKAKESGAAKGGKQARQDGKETKASASEKNIMGTKGKGKTNKDASTPGDSDKKVGAPSKTEKGNRDPVRVLSKPSSSSQKVVQTPAAPAPGSAPPKAPAGSSDSSAVSVPTERKQRKVGAEVKSLLQRDLGLGGNGGRRKRGEVAPGTTNGDNSKSSSRRQSSSIQNATATLAESPAAAPLRSNKNAQPGSVPLAKSNNSQVSINKDKEPGGSSKPSNVMGQQTQPAPSASSSQTSSSHGPTQAFLKHANASQGVTESILQMTMSAFGGVNRVEVDKKKGFAYVDFADADALQKAITASPIKVGQGSVTVLERRDKSAKQEKQEKQNKSTAVSTAPQSPAPTKSNDKTSAPTLPANNSNPNGNAGTSRGGTHRGHRPRGNRGRGPGRSGAEKTAQQGPTSEGKLS